MYWNDTGTESEAKNYTIHEKARSSLYYSIDAEVTTIWELSAVFPIHIRLTYADPDPA